MPKFFYTAKNITTGETAGGEAEAKDERTLAQDLRAQGILLTSHKEIEAATSVSIRFFDRFTSVPLKEKMIFTRNLAVMVSSGLTVSRAIHNLSVQTKNKKFRQILLSVYDDVQAGMTLSEGLAKYPGVFNELFVNMVGVGEVSGNLEEILDILALQLEKEHDLNSKVRGALIYPAVIVAAMIGIAILMLTYILPKITSVFQDMDVKLPATTLFIIGISDFLRNNAILSIALTIVSKTLGNVYYKDALAEAIGEVQKGVELSKVIGKYPRIFPVLVAQILEVGEETGKTETVLRRLAEFYEEEVSQITKNMSSIIEPILMLVIGGGVGFFAVAMLQPMYSVLENIK
jgi:type IV pilus assembly protein PilC